MISVLFYQALIQCCPNHYKYYIIVYGNVGVVKFVEGCVYIIWNIMYRAELIV